MQIITIPLISLIQWSPPSNPGANIGAGSSWVVPSTPMVFSTIPASFHEATDRMTSFQWSPAYNEGASSPLLHHRESSYITTPCMAWPACCNTTSAS